MASDGVAAKLHVFAIEEVELDLVGFSQAVGPGGREDVWPRRLHLPQHARVEQGRHVHRRRVTPPRGGLMSRGGQMPRPATRTSTRRATRRVTRRATRRATRPTIRPATRSFASPFASPAARSTTHRAATVARLGQSRRVGSEVIEHPGHVRESPVPWVERVLGRLVAVDGWALAGEEYLGATLPSLAWTSACPPKVETEMRPTGHDVVVGVDEPDGRGAAWLGSIQQS